MPDPIFPRQHLLDISSDALELSRLCQRSRAGDQGEQLSVAITVFESSLRQRVEQCPPIPAGAPVVWEAFSEVRRLLGAIGAEQDGKTLAGLVCDLGEAGDRLQRAVEAIPKMLLEEALLHTKERQAFVLSSAQGSGERSPGGEDEGPLKDGMIGADGRIWIDGHRYNLAPQLKKLTSYLLSKPTLPLNAVIDRMAFRDSGHAYKVLNKLKNKLTVAMAEKPRRLYFRVERSTDETLSLVAPVWESHQKSPQVSDSVGK